MQTLLQRLWAPGEQILAAVSGGADSVALLLLLRDLADSGEIRLSPAHLDDVIRGEASAADARFVRDLCERLKVPLTTGYVDVPLLARASGTGLESAAREARRLFLSKAKEESGADWIALAHHADDQAETVLMHLLRGAGMDGAAGMRRVSGSFIRPLLGVRKEDLLSFLKGRGQPYVTDLTNFEPDTLRNQIRLRALPLLESLWPGSARALCRFAHVQRDETDWLESLARAWLDARLRVLPMGKLIAPDPRPPSPALVRRALHALCGFGLEHSQRLADLYFSARGALSLPSLRAERRLGGLYLIDPRVKKPGSVPLGDGASLGGYCAIRLRAPGDPAPIRDDPYRQTLDARSLQGASLRVRAPGDRFRMLGAPGDRLLSDVLTDRKVDRPLRDFLPLVAREQWVLWIPGIGVSEHAKLTPGRPALELTYEGIHLTG